MPELPEVEVIKRSLKRNIIKTTIKKVKIYPDTVDFPLVDLLTKNLKSLVKISILTVDFLLKFIFTFGYIIWSAFFTDNYLDDIGDNPKLEIEIHRANWWRGI